MGLNQLSDDLRVLIELLAEGELQTVVDRRYPFDQIDEAYRYVEQESYQPIVRYGGTFYRLIQDLFRESVFRA